MATINTSRGFSGAAGVSGLSGTKPSAQRQPVGKTDLGTNSGQVLVGLEESDESSRVEVQSALDNANNVLGVRQQRLELSVDSETGMAMVSIRVTKSGQI